MIRKKRGQSAVELATLTIIILGALITMGTYFRRGIQGRWRSAVDDLGDQYDPRVTNSDVLQTLVTNTYTEIRTEETPTGFWTLRDDQSNSIEIKNGTIRVGAY